jgi:hypothetical protein
MGDSHHHKAFTRVGVGKSDASACAVTPEDKKANHPQQKLFHGNPSTYDVCQFLKS